MSIPEAAYEKLMYYGRHSVTGRFFGAVGRGFDRLVANSLIFSALGREESYECGEKSLIGRILKGIWSIFPAAARGCGALKEHSLFASYLAATIGDWQRLPVAWIGSLLLPLSILAYVMGGIIGGAVVFIFALVLMMVPTTMAGVAAGSRLISFCHDVTSEQHKTRKGIYWPPFIFSMITAMIAAFVGWLPAAALFGVVVGGVLLLCYPQLGLMLLIFAAPFLPTMILVGLTGVILICYLAAQIGGADRPFRLDNAGALIFGFALLLIFFGLTSFTPLKSIQIAMVECVFILGYFLVLWLIDTRERVQAMVFLFCLAACGCGLVGLYQYLSGDVNTTWTDTELFTTLQLRIYSTFENPNVYGEFLLLSLPCAAVMVYISEKPLMKLFYGGTTLLLLVNLALTYSRGCYLALMFIFFLTVCWGMRKLLIFVPFVLAAMPFVMPDSITERFASIVNFSDHSTSYRMNIWLGVLNMLEVYCLLGIGLGQEAFTMIYSKYQMNQIFAPHAHNLYLQVTSEMGIAGLLLLLGFLLAFFAVGYMAHRKVKGSKTSWFILVMMAAVGGFLMEGIFDNVWYNYRVFLVFFMVLGLVSAVSRLVLKEQKSVFDRE